MKTKASVIDKKCEDGESVIEQLDLSESRSSKPKVKAKASTLFRSAAHSKSVKAR